MTTGLLIRIDTCLTDDQPRVQARDQERNADRTRPRRFRITTAIAFRAVIAGLLVVIIAHEAVTSASGTNLLTDKHFAVPIAGLAGWVFCSIQAARYSRRSASAHR
jgi:hypothetical protein